MASLNRTNSEGNRGEAQNDLKNEANTYSTHGLHNKPSQPKSTREKIHSSSAGSISQSRAATPMRARELEAGKCTLTSSAEFNTKLDILTLGHELQALPKALGDCYAQRYRVADHRRRAVYNCTELKRRLQKLAQLFNSVAAESHKLHLSIDAKENMRTVMEQVDTISHLISNHLDLTHVLLEQEECLSQKEYQLDDLIVAITKKKVKTNTRSQRSNLDSDNQSDSELKGSLDRTVPPTVDPNDVIKLFRDSDIGDSQDQNTSNDKTVSTRENVQAEIENLSEKHEYFEAKISEARRRVHDERLIIPAIREEFRRDREALESRNTNITVKYYRKGMNPKKPRGLPTPIPGLENPQELATGLSWPESRGRGSSSLSHAEGSTIADENKVHRKPSSFNRIWTATDVEGSYTQPTSHYPRAMESHTQAIRNDFREFDGLAKPVEKDLHLSSTSILSAEGNATNSSLWSTVAEFGNTDSGFCRRNPAEASEFFTTGRVFCMRSYTDIACPIGRYAARPAGYTNHGQELYAHLEKMIVVNKGFDFCLAVPIEELGGKGLTEIGVRSSFTSAYAVVHNEDREPYSLFGVPLALKEPIAVKMKGTNRLDVASCINFEKIQTINHNVKAMDIGSVSPKSMQHFNSLWKAHCWR